MRVSTICTPAPPGQIAKKSWKTKLHLMTYIMTNIMIIYIMIYLKNNIMVHKITNIMINVISLLLIK